MKFIICIPIGQKTGGGESLHQLAFLLEKAGYCAGVYYLYGKSKISIIPKYDVTIFTEIEDTEDCILVVPETETGWLSNYFNVKKVIWWLSLDFYNHFKIENRVKKKLGKLALFSPIVCKLLSFTNVFPKHQWRYFDFEDEKVFHLYNCEYVRNFLEENAIAESCMQYLCAPISEEHFSKEKEIKEDIVIYNPIKGVEFTQELISKSLSMHKEIKYVAIENMTPSEVAFLESKAKVYIDFGEFPGPERIPREAVFHNCIIISSRNGAAANKIDVPIPEKYKFNVDEKEFDRIFKLIELSFLNYELMVNDFLPYKQKVMKQHENFLNDILQFAKVFH